MTNLRDEIERGIRGNWVARGGNQDGSYWEGESTREFATRIALLALEEAARICGSKAKDAMNLAGEARHEQQFGTAAFYENATACYNECEQAIRAFAGAAYGHQEQYRASARAPSQDNESGEG